MSAWNVVSNCYGKKTHVLSNAACRTVYKHSLVLHSFFAGTFNIISWSQFTIKMMISSKSRFLLIQLVLWFMIFFFLIDQHWLQIWYCVIQPFTALLSQFMWCNKHAVLKQTLSLVWSSDFYTRRRFKGFVLFTTISVGLKCLAVESMIFFSIGNRHMVLPVPEIRETA